MQFIRLADILQYLGIIHSRYGIFWTIQYSRLSLHNFISLVTHWAGGIMVDSHVHMAFGNQFGFLLILVIQKLCHKWNAMQLPPLQYYLHNRHTMLYQLTRLPRLIGLVHWTTKLCFSLVQKHNLLAQLGKGPGARFSKVLKSFCTWKAIAKSQTLWLQSCFIHIFLI